MTRTGMNFPMGDKHRNDFHIVCDCNECEKTEAIIERLKKRRGEVDHAHTDTKRLVWTLDAFAIVKLELKRILGEKDD